MFNMSFAVKKSDIKQRIARLNALFSFVETSNGEFETCNEEVGTHCELRKLTGVENAHASLEA